MLEKDFLEMLARMEEEEHKIMCCKAIKLHGGAFSVTGTPDLLIIINGIPILVEMKSDKGQRTRKQIYENMKWREAGAKVIMARSYKEVMEYVKQFTV